MSFIIAAFIWSTLLMLWVFLMTYWAWCVTHKLRWYEHLFDEISRKFHWYDERIRMYERKPME
jgi:hypothetical protein